MTLPSTTPQYDVPIPNFYSLDVERRVRNTRECQDEYGNFISSVVGITEQEICYNYHPFRHGHWAFPGYVEGWLKKCRLQIGGTYTAKVFSTVMKHFPHCMPPSYYDNCPYYAEGKSIRVFNFDELKKQIADDRTIA